METKVKNKIKIYFIDDEPVLCELFRELFSSDTAQIITFTNPSEAVESAKLKSPDLIFIDFRLPGITGDELAKQLPAGIPKYLVTGDLNAKVTYEFQGVLVKPFKIDIIRGVIDSHLKHQTAL